MANNQIVISRIQNRRGIRENLPQPLLPGEFALTVDTGELWIGTDPNQPPFGVRTYGSGSGDISAAEDIADNQIVSAKFVSGSLGEVAFGQLRDTLVADATFTLVDEDILWDGRDTVFIAADTSVNVNNTILGIYEAVENSGFGTLLYTYAQALAGTYYVSLGALNDPTVDPAPPSYAFDPADGDFLFTIAGSNAEQGANAATLINKIHGAQLVTTLANLQVTTTGIGVGSPSFLNWVMYNNEANLPVAPTWVAADTPQTISADSVTDTMRVVAGEGISIDADTTEDYFRITNTYAGIPTNEFTLTANTTSFTNVTNLNFDIDSVSDVIFLDYSLNISGGVASSNNYTAGGNMVVVGDKNVGTGTATLTDNQVEVRDAVDDPDFANVVLISEFEGADGEITSYTAETGQAFTFNNGTTAAELDTAQQRLGSSSLYYSNSLSRSAYFSHNANLNLGTNPFCIETSVRMVNFSSNASYVFISKWNFDTNNRSYLLYWDKTNIVWASSTDGTSGTGVNQIVHPWSPSENVWYDLAVTYDGTTIRLYIDGIRVAETVASPSYFASNANLGIGGYADANAADEYEGWIDHTRITIGSARYTGASYTVVEEAFPTSLTGAPLTGDVNFQATYVAGTPNRIQIQYTNTFDNDVTMRVVRKRWMSY